MSRTPRGLVTAMGALAAVAAALLVVPMIALALRTPWDQIATLARQAAVTSAVRTSLAASLCALVMSTVLGVPLAWVLARLDFPGKTLLRAATVLPMVLPPVVGGVALLLAFGRRGVVGGPIADATGLALPFSFAGVVVAATFVAMPFLVLTVEAGLRSMDTRYEDAAATLGAGRMTVFRRITLPLVTPSLVGGMALCWTRALGEFGATITFAGNVPGRTQTVPLAVYLQLETNPAAAYLLSFSMLALSLIVLLTLRGRLMGGA